MKQVLLVEDDRDLAEMLAEVLEERYQVALAFDGQHGLEQMFHRRFDVVVADLLMPTLGGCKMLREMQERGYDTPVIISSGTPELADEGVRLQVQEVLAKPYEVERLLEAIERVTGNTNDGPNRHTTDEAAGGRTASR